MAKKLLLVEVPDGTPFNFDAFNIGYYETPERYVSVRCPIEFVNIPTEEEKYNERMRLIDIYGTDNSAKCMQDYDEWLMSRLLSDPPDYQARTVDYNTETEEK